MLSTRIFIVFLMRSLSVKGIFVSVVFFFQAEDGIRDIGVTGVQTCALPICRHGAQFVGSNAPVWIGRLFSRKADVPYGVAIAFGALMAFSHGALATGVILPF